MKKFRHDSVTSASSMLAIATSALAVSGCGGGSGGGGLATRIKGFPNSYVAPKSDYFTPTEVDPNFEILKPNYVDPYWVASLEMDQWGTHRPDA